MADAMVATGLAAAGYTYLNLDDCWMVARGADGSTTPDPVRFPSGIAALAHYVHAKGLRFGLYQAPGGSTPQGRPGLLGHEAQDVATFCGWGVDYLKLDSKGSTQEGWQKVRDAIDACEAGGGRPIYLQVAFCKSVAACTLPGSAATVANGWRTSGDSQANWASVMSSVGATEPLWPLAGPTGPNGGHWNDPDFLLVGQPGGLSAEETKSQIALWSFMNVPLLLSCDLRALAAPAAAPTLALLTNPRMLALNQDALGYQGRRLGAPPPPPAPTPPTSPPATVQECDGANADQEWLAADAAGGANGGRRLLHAASGLALGFATCAGTGGAKPDVALALAPPGGGANCSGGLEQLWLFNGNGTVTSALDGACLDVFDHTNPVQAHWCTADKSGAPAISQAWGVAQKNSSSAVVILRFEGAAPTYTTCLQGHALAAAAVSAPAAGGAAAAAGDAEVWEKQLANGDVALLLLNRGAAPTLNISVNLAAVPGIENATVRVTDVWTGKQDPGAVAGALWRAVPSHGASVLRLSPAAGRVSRE